eukprot:COSAG06_NODE_3669_length_5040_cov_3.451123_2_plen_275_part_00
MKLKVSGLGARPPFVALVHKHVLGGTTYDQVDSETGTAGCMLHMRRGDVLSVRLTALPDASAAELRAVERLGAALSIELCMRKRKRMDEFAEEGESPAPLAKAAPAAAAPAHRRATSKASRRRERKRRATAPAAAAAAATSAPAADTSLPADAKPEAKRGPEHGHSGVADRCFESDDHTGSDTEWSEGFSSDDEERRAARAPKRVRRLEREIREVHVSADASDEERGDSTLAGGDRRAEEEAEVAARIVGMPEAEAEARIRQDRGAAAAAAAPT